MNKQGRAITESYEMLELPATAVGGGSGKEFRIDSTNKPLLAVAADTSGRAFGYANNEQLYLTSDTSTKFPPLRSMGVCDVTFVSVPLSGPVTIPVMVNSAIAPSEDYIFFYKYNPYQGLLSSPAYGKILSTGPAVTTTAGSGLITDASYSDGSVSVVINSTSVTGHSVEWPGNVSSGDLLVLNDDSLQRGYKIASVNGSSLTLENPMRTITGDYTYSISSRDRPFFNQSDIIDRMPIMKNESEVLAQNELIGFSNSDDFPVLKNQIVNKTQDIASLSAYDFTIGANPVDTITPEGRGRSTVSINPELAPKGVHSLGLSLQSLFPTADYKRTYQSYILNKFEDGTSGKLYMMVVGGERDTSGYECFLNEKDSSDVVDIFHLPGRPLIAG
jgi:hypothetical protein